MPYAAYKLMRILRGWELPNHHWKGYRLRGDTLWTPEGHPLRAADATWWSLTVRMAHEFRAIMARTYARASADRRQPVALARIEAAVVALTPDLASGAAAGLVYSSTSEKRISQTPENKGSGITGPDRGSGPVVVALPSSASARQGRQLSTAAVQLGGAP